MCIRDRSYRSRAMEQRNLKLNKTFFDYRTRLNSAHAKTPAHSKAKANAEFVKTLRFDRNKKLSSSKAREVIINLRVIDNNPSYDLMLQGNTALIHLGRKKRVRSYVNSVRRYNKYMSLKS
eukprot:TRINITY_DN16951_c0_g1_i1.p1 TRINITY_DN16951_c0_g1~~TRINITY_DN16951_c0_g1_i1.p1  ORF type:complete len:121 (-),score=14.39 TRINITY_DN16951_c0_g1_i1:160-522(-)